MIIKTFECSESSQDLAHPEFIPIACTDHLTCLTDPFKERPQCWTLFPPSSQAAKQISSTILIPSLFLTLHNPRQVWTSNQVCTTISYWTWLTLEYTGNWVNAYLTVWSCHVYWVSEYFIIPYSVYSVTVKPEGRFIYRWLTSFLDFALCFAVSVTLSYLV